MSFYQFRHQLIAEGPFGPALAASIQASAVVQSRRKPCSRLFNRDGGLSVSMLFESALIWFGVIETLNQAFLRLSSGMSRGKGCWLSGGSTSVVTTSVVTTGSEGRGG